MLAKEAAMHALGFRFRLIAGGLLALMLGSAAQAQDYPSRPVTIILPAAAGNSPDVLMRVVADRLSQIWKPQIVILNRPGAGGLIAAPAAAAPRANARSMIGPDSRVSCPTSSRSGFAREADRTRTSAQPRRATVSSSSGGRPARPRTPSVPKRLLTGS
jgi:hypothetical protein